MGLPARVQNLVILAFAAQADRAPVRNGAPVTISLDRIDDTVELREEALPDETTWAKARERAAALFGLKSGEVRKGATLSALAAELLDKGAAKRTLLADLLKDLWPRADRFGVAATAPRFTTMRSAQTLLGDLAGAAAPLARVEALADANWKPARQPSDVSWLRFPRSGRPWRRPTGTSSRPVLAWAIIARVPPRACGRSSSRCSTQTSMRFNSSPFCATSRPGPRGCWPRRRLRHSRQSRRLPRPHLRRRPVRRWWTSANKLCWTLPPRRRRLTS